MNFKGRIEIINGKKMIVIDPVVEEIIREDGSKDVVVHAPTLSAIQKAVELGSKEKRGN